MTICSIIVFFFQYCLANRAKHMNIKNDRSILIYVCMRILTTVSSTARHTHCLANGWMAECQNDWRNKKKRTTHCTFPFVYNALAVHVSYSLYVEYYMLKFCVFCGVDCLLFQLVISLLLWSWLVKSYLAWACSRLYWLSDSNWIIPLDSSHPLFQSVAPSAK